MKEEKKFKTIPFDEAFLNKQRKEIFYKLKQKEKIKYFWLLPAFSAALLFLAFFLGKNNIKSVKNEDFSFYASMDMIEDLDVLEAADAEELK
ncbi:MAG: hypothetical protein GX447_09390 [Elusimicrobia bacterium]|nr:hypothetical protein [Elusimicrobiota bacterium]